MLLLSYQQGGDMEDSIENKPETNTTKATKTKSKKGSFIKKLFYFLVIIILIAGSGIGGYYLRDQSAKTDNDKNKTAISNLTKLNKNLSEQLSELTADDETDSTQSFAVASCTSTANNNVKSSTVENIQASITSGNTAALEGYMASSVCFVLAASDGIGDVTAATAVETLTDYLPNGDTWTFSPTTSELASYKSGNYSNFFVDGAIIGKSSSNKIVVISFNEAGKIDVIFWSTTQDELM